MTAPYTTPVDLTAIPARSSLVIMQFPHATSW